MGWLLLEVKQPEGQNRMISINFILKQLFDILEIEYKFIPVTRVTPACSSSLQVMSKKKSILENSCLNCRSCTLYMKVAWRI